MEFPVYLPIGTWNLHPHTLFESLAYFIGFRLYLRMRRSERLSPLHALWIVTAAAIGAAAGSKLLYWLENPALTWQNASNIVYLMAGKTIVGGLLGGLIAVEWTKKKLGITSSTGDDMAIPLAAAMCIGRIGCFLTGISDHTYGTPTKLPWGVDFGDGMKRHPTQLYEIAFLLLIILSLVIWNRRIVRKRLQPLPDGARFQLFMASYLAFRLAVDFIKPTPHLIGGMNNIQFACIAGLLYYAYLMAPWIIARYRGREHVHHAQRS